MIILIVGLSAAVVGAYGPMLSPGFVQVSAELGISVEVLSQLTAWVVLTIGLSLFITNPLAKVFGRRPVYLVAICIMFASSVWGAAVTSYRSLLASRIIGGIGMAPYEVLVQCTIGDLYFVHERATRIAVWNLFLLAGISGGSMISGYIIQFDGYRWTFGVCAIFFGVLMLGVIFLVPETAYRRDFHVPIVVKYYRRQDGVHDMLGYEHKLQDSEKAATDEHHIESTSGATEKKHTYLQSLRVFTGRYSHAPIWKIFLRPVVMWFYPAVLWAFLIYGELRYRTDLIQTSCLILMSHQPTTGTTITWIVVFSVVNGVIFVAPPYNFTVSQTGLISLSPFILTIIGEAVSGPLNDWICVSLTKKNRGIYEPEFRLPLILVAVVLGTVGFFGFGATIHFQTHWLGPVLCFGLANMSLVFAATCVFGYIIDSYKKHNEEAFVAINARNLLTFGLTYFVNDWLAEQGPLKVFCILGALFLVVCALTIPLW